MRIQRAFYRGLGSNGGGGVVDAPLRFKSAGLESAGMMPGQCEVRRRDEYMFSSEWRKVRLGIEDDGVGGPE